MTEAIPAPINYAANVASFLEYRTGKKPESLSATEIIRHISKAGYFTMSAGQIMVLLIDENSASLTSKIAIAPMLAKVTGTSGFGAIRELIIAPIIRSSHTKVNALKALRLQLAVSISADVFVRIEANGIFAFNTLKRAAFAPRRSLLAAKAPLPRLTSEVLIDGEKNKYKMILRDFGQIAPLEEGDPLCVWNGYRVGDIVEIQTLSMNTIGAIEIRRVIPSSLPKEETEQEAETPQE